MPGYVHAYAHAGQAYVYRICLINRSSINNRAHVTMGPLSGYNKRNVFVELLNLLNIHRHQLVIDDTLIMADNTARRTSDTSQRTLIPKPGHLLGVKHVNLTTLKEAMKCEGEQFAKFLVGFCLESLLGSPLTCVDSVCHAICRQQFPRSQNCHEETKQICVEPILCSRSYYIFATSGQDSLSFVYYYTGPEQAPGAE